MIGVVLQNESLIAVINSLAQYRNTFQSSYSALLYEARIVDTCQDLVSCGPLQGAVRPWTGVTSV